MLTKAKPLDITKLSREIFGWGKAFLFGAWTRVYIIGQQTDGKWRISIDANSTDRLVDENEVELYGEVH